MGQKKKKESLKIPKWYSEDVNRKYTEKRPIMICQTLHRNERLSTKNPIEHWG
jgi:hypothetical protein